MTMNKWPSFITRDLGPEDDAEMTRRWEAYDRDMKALIATGGFHQDEDGWWVETATGDLVGPDPLIERPLSASELAGMKPLAEVLPELAESISRSRGRPAKEHPKTAVTLRIDPRVVERYQAGGADWRAKMAEALERAVSHR